MIFKLILMVLKLNFFGLISVMLNNVFWVFGFLCLGYLFFGWKNFFKWFLVIIFAVILINSFLPFPTLFWTFKIKLFLKKLPLNLTGLFYFSEVIISFATFVVAVAVKAVIGIWGNSSFKK